MTTVVNDLSAAAAGRGEAGGGEAGGRRRSWPPWRGHGLSESLLGYAFIGPALGLFAVMGAYTIARGFALSFAEWNGFTPNWVWVGIDNYLDLLWRDPAYAPAVQEAARNTLWVLIAVPLLTIAVSFPLAVLLNSVRRFRAVLRSVYFLPHVTAGIAIYFAWQYILEPDGAINLVLGSVGLGSLEQPQGFLGNPDTALPTLIIVTVWTTAPVAMLLYLTGLQAIDSSVTEAAQIDGAGWWRTNLSVVWPLLNGMTLVVLLLQVRHALQSFEVFLIMTNGGPGEATNVLGLETYRLAFQSDMRATLGMSSALGWMLFVVALIVALVNQRLLRSRT
ncbi:carbohydrate ABC transporter permease [Jiangella alkaliphila]|uniref:Multiple sugar transport system permease protein n=1 Tax=Jiangella alkaliphila TaxID=419479 RepID=A0A1H2LFY0_9ACTN|nr:sugar ABC transporter permease [Jiangella alkaliphila]SDU79724.1 multiple sugar transport system permease protein [Jiangella alkaliphila]